MSRGDSGRLKRCVFLHTATKYSMLTNQSMIVPPFFSSIDTSITHTHTHTHTAEYRAEQHAAHQAGVSEAPEGVQSTTTRLPG